LEELSSFRQDPKPKSQPEAPKPQVRTPVDQKESPSYTPAPTYSPPPQHSAPLGETKVNVKIFCAACGGQIIGNLPFVLCDYKKANFIQFFKY